MTTQPDYCGTGGSTLQEFLFNSSIPKLESTKPKRRYDIEVDEDTHWELVRMAAAKEQHQEDYVEQLLVKLAAGHRAAVTLIKDIEEAAQ